VETYQSVVGVSLDNESVFLTLLYAMARGERRALQHVRQQARRELQEIERTAESEALSILPGTVEELIEELENPASEIDIAVPADALGATHGCATCSTKIIEPDTLSEAVVLHYELSEAAADNARERIANAIYSSGVETGGLGSSSRCSYCHAQDSRGD